MALAIVLHTARPRICQTGGHVPGIRLMVVLLQDALGLPEGALQRRVENCIYRGILRIPVPRIQRCRRSRPLPLRPRVSKIAYCRYSEYPIGQKGEAYRDEVFSYIEQEDSPRPLCFQLDLLRQVGFGVVDVLHKNTCFAAFGAVKMPMRPETQ